MPKFKGRDLRIKVRTSTGPDVFTVVGGARSCTNARRDTMSLFNDYFKAVYVALDATTGLTGIISESLSNADPFPKIWIEDGGADDWSNKDDNGLEAFVNLHVGSQKEGTKEIRGLIASVEPLRSLCNMTLND